MSIHEHHGLSGRVHIVVRDGDGRITDERRIPNLITDTGRLVLAQLFAGQVQAQRLLIAVGTDATPALASQATLSRVADAKASIVVDATVANGQAVARVVATLPATNDPNPQSIQEAGIVIVLPDREVVYNRVTFPVINRAGKLEMTFSWEVSF